MQLQSILFFLALGFVSCASAKQQKSITQHPETEAIRKTINTYFEGWMTGDTTLLGKAMHATCQLKNVKDNGVIVFDRAKYLSFFKPRPRRQNSGGRIVSIDITGNIAAAKCEIHTPDRLYTDYFNMMKLEDTWYIVDKIATNEMRKKE